jgi:lipopolysaccharide/colanic/teichoic acid biosynthesis glycosyltransferase
MIQPRTETLYARAGKRVFDIVLAVPMLLLLLVPMIVIGAAVLIFSGPPILFTQERIGRFGRRFRILKYRSMVRSAAAGGPVTVGGDPRITRVGKVLRQWKLDELPQLWNVIRGEMSLVGPRADVPGFMDRLQGEDRLILTLRPGLTGPATLAYRNEEALLALQRDPEQYNAEVLFPAKVNINKAYLKNLSFGGDVSCLIATVAAIIREEGLAAMGGYAGQIESGNCK